MRILLIALAVSSILPPLPAAKPLGFQSGGGGYSILLIKRASELRKQKLAARVVVHRNAANETRTAARTKQREHWDRISHAPPQRVLVAYAPVVIPSVKKSGPPPAVIQTKRKYVADVMVKVQDERGHPINGQTVAVTVSRDGKPVALAPQNGGALLASRTIPAGYRPNVAMLPVQNGAITLKGVEVPAALTVRLSEGASGEWSIVGDEGVGSVVIGTSEPSEETGVCSISPETRGTIIPGLTRKDPPKLTTITNPKTGKPQKVKLTLVSETHRLNVEIPTTVVMRREVADFVVPKPEVVQAAPTAKSHLFLGEEKEGENGLSTTDDAKSWSFRLRRDSLGADTDLVVQTDTANGSFGGSIPLPKVDFYEPNRIPAPKLELEAIAEPRISVAGRTVDESFPLSPIQWRSAGAEPLTMTGADALKLLGVATKGFKPLVPDADKKRRGRYGQWLVLDKLGVSLHCRFDKDRQIKDQILPGEPTMGMLEAVRVTSEQGGKIGDSLYVGATRQEVERAFGQPDAPIPNLERIGLTDAATHSLNLYGTKDIETPTDTYLYDGLRISYRNDRVAWYELSRPVQLLYDGARAFIPEEARTIYIGEANGNIPEIADNLRRALRLSAEQMGGMQPVSNEADADFVLSGSIEASAQKINTTHTYSRSVKYKDSKGKTKYRTDVYKEGFLCEEGSGSAEIKLRLFDRRMNKEIPVSNLTMAFSSGGHHEGTQCQCDPDALLRSSLSSGRIEDSITRPLNRIATNASNMLGTVLAVNYDTGAMLINLGKKHGVHSKSEGDEGSELTLILTHSVNLKTGAPVDLDKAKFIMGYKPEMKDGKVEQKKLPEWLEVQEVGEDWCIAKPKTKGSTFEGGKTKDAVGQIDRLLDPGSGLLRVRIAQKRGAKS